MSLPVPPEPLISSEPLAEASVGGAINNLAAAINGAAKGPRKKTDPWNSLELTKVVISALTPILVIIVGIFVARAEHRQDTLTSARIKSYDVIKDDLNRIHCFIADVGTWKEETPYTIIGYKRTVDREMYENRGIWSQKTFTAYTTYMDAAFATFQDSGTDARIQTDVYEKDNNSKWNKQWDPQLTGSEATNYRAAYDAMYKAFTDDIAR